MHGTWILLLPSDLRAIRYRTPATRYGLDGSGIKSQWGRDFPRQYRPGLGPTQPPIQWVPGISPGVKMPGRGVEHPPPANIIIFKYALQPLRLIVRSGSDVSTFATRHLHACHNARAHRGEKVELWARNVREFCLNSDIHVAILGSFTRRKATTWDLRLYFPLRRIFFSLKIRRLRPSANPRTWVPKASTLPLGHRSRRPHH